MRYLIRAYIATTAFAALLVVPSIASAGPTLTHPTGTPAPVGTKLLATNVLHSGTPKGVKFTSNVNFECEEATLTGELTSNAGGHVAGNITTAEFKNAGVGTCSSSLGALQVTPSHTKEATHNGANSLPWCVTGNTNDDKLTVRGGKCSEAARNLFFTLDPPGLSCTYSKVSLTVTYTTHPADAVATVNPGQGFPKVTGGIFCPNELALDVAFTLTTDVNGVSGAPLYVDTV